MDLTQITGSAGAVRPAQTNQSLVQARKQRDLTRPSLDAQTELAKRTVSALEDLLKQQQRENAEFSAIEQPAQLVKYLVPGTNEEMTLSIKSKPVDPLMHAKRGLTRTNEKTALNLLDVLPPVSTETKAVVHRVRPEVSNEEKLEWRNMPRKVVSNWKNKSGALIDLETRAKAHPKRQVSVASGHLDFAKALDLAEQETDFARTPTQSMRKIKEPRVSKPKPKPKTYNRIQFEPAQS